MTLPSTETTEPGTDRVAIVTGMSRRSGIAAAVVARLIDDNYRVLATGWTDHDATMPWGDDPDGGATLAEELDSGTGRLDYIELDLENPHAAEQLMDQAIIRYGQIDVVVAAHAHSSTQALLDVDIDELDKAWAINTRASLLLAKAFGHAFDPDWEDGRIVFFTSGQHLGPMGDEIAYAISKGAIQQMTLSVADQLADRNITVNCINPGPVDTGWATGQTHADIAARFPSGRWGQPSDVAGLVSFLVSPEGAWISGQTINSEGGFRRSR